MYFEEVWRRSGYAGGSSEVIVVTERLLDPISSHHHLLLCPLFYCLTWQILLFGQGRLGSANSSNEQILITNYLHHAPFYVHGLNHHPIISMEFTLCCTSAFSELDSHKQEKARKRDSLDGVKCTGMKSGCFGDRGVEGE